MIEATLRDATDLVKKLGTWKSTGPVKLLVFERGSLPIAYRTPFQKLPAESPHTRYVRAPLSGKPNLPYGLDIWHNRKKVLNVEWDDKGTRDIVTYRPGSWEASLRSICQSNRWSRTSSRQSLEPVLNARERQDKNPSRRVRRRETNNGPRWGDPGPSFAGRALGADVRLENSTRGAGGRSKSFNAASSLRATAGATPPSAS